jgi:hypothetical protein
MELGFDVAQDMMEDKARSKASDSLETSASEINRQSSQDNKENVVNRSQGRNDMRLSPDPKKASRSSGRVLGARRQATASPRSKRRKGILSRRRKSRRVKSRRVKSRRVKSRRVKSRRVKSRRVKSRRVKSRRVKSRRVKSRRVKSRRSRCRKSRSI